MPRRHLSFLALVSLTALVPLSACAQSGIGWANTQWPPSFLGSSCLGIGIYGQIWIDGVTNVPGPAAGVQAELGLGTPGSTPGNGWVWQTAVYNVDVGNNDEYVVYMNTFLPVGTYDYGYRYRYNNGPWLYTDFSGPSGGGALTNPGVATIIESCGPVATVPTTWGAVKARFDN